MLSGSLLSCLKKTKISRNGHSLSFVVPLVVIRCQWLFHSLSLVVIRCTTHCHLLSLDILLVCLFINDPKPEVHLVHWCSLKRFFEKFCEIERETPVWDSQFKKSLKPATFEENRLQFLGRYFPGILAKFLITSFCRSSSGDRFWAWLFCCKRALETLTRSCRKL